MAAARLVDELTKVALGRYAIAVIGDEPRLAYNRVLLSSVLAGETASHDIELRPASWWGDRGVTLKYGCVATEIDVGRRELKIANEESIGFSRLVLATGSMPLRLNVPGADLASVHTFRDSRDVDMLLTLAAQKRRVVVVGGGLLGLEAAYGLSKAGPASRGSNCPTDAGSMPMRWFSRPASGRISRWRRKPAFPSIAASWSMMSCKPARRISSRSANAPSIAASVTAWSNRPTSRHACWRGISQGVLLPTA